MRIAFHPAQPVARAENETSPRALGTVPPAAETPFGFTFRDVDVRKRDLASIHRKALARANGQRYEVQRPVNVGVLCLGGMGGSGKVARASSVALAEAGHRVFLLTSPDDFWDDAQLEKIVKKAVGAPRAPTEPRDHWVKPLAAQIVENVRKHGIEILNVHYALGLLEAAVDAKNALAKEGKRLTLAVTLHGTDVTTWAHHPEQGPKLAAQLAECDEVTAVSHCLAGQAVDAFSLERRPRVIENSIDEIRFHPGQWSNLRQRIAPNGEVILCHVSNMRPVKRPLDAVEVFARVRNAGIAAKLLLVGDGPMMDEVYQRALLLGVADDIVATGAQPPDKLAKYLAASDLALVTSENESFCLAALEAMACGTPVVGSRCGGLEEIMSSIDRGANRVSRLLADVGDVEQMASTCLELLRSSKRYARVQRQCIALPLDRYPADRQAQGYLTMIDDLRSSGLALRKRRTRRANGPLGARTV